MSSILLLGIGAIALGLTRGKSAESKESKENKSIIDLVNSVLDKEFKLPDYHNFDYKVIDMKEGRKEVIEEEEEETSVVSDVDEDDESSLRYVNPDDEMKGLATQVVNQDFLAKKENMFRFLQLVIQTYTTAIEYYVERSASKIKVNDIRFVYKGGNILRMIANEFMLELPGYAAEVINEFYKPYFRKSDADFSIYINPKIEDFEKVHLEICLLSYLLQEYIRNQLEADLPHFFEFYRLNESAQKEILTDFLDATNKADVLQDPTNEKYFDKKIEAVAFQDLKVSNENIPSSTFTYDADPDMFILRYPKSKTKVISFYPFKDDGHKNRALRIQYNDALDFKATPTSKHRSIFSLVRTKILFSLDLEGKAISIGGELIDVSIPKKQDTKLQQFFKEPHIIQAYELKFNEETLRFFGYSIFHLIRDLEAILFEDNEKPWYDKKYIKRLNRLMYFCFVDVFLKMPNNERRSEYIKAFCKMVASRGLKEDYKESMSAFLKKTKMETGFNVLTKRIIQVAILNQSDIEYGQYEKFIQTIQENCIHLLQALKNIGHFCSRNAQISEKKMYQARFSDVV